MAGNSSTTKPGAALILVTGPSGVGKDSLLIGVQKLMSADPRLRFATRVITRPASPSGEQHRAVNKEEFLRLKAAGEFWIDWQAHETCYALPLELHTALTHGVSVLANISRTVIGALAERWENTVVVEIGADPECIRQRLQKRARENAAQIASRLSRKVPPAPDSVTLHKVDNSGTREAGINSFHQLLESILPSPSVANHHYVLEEQIGFQLRRAHQYASAVFQERMSALSLTPPQFSALVKIRQHGSVSQNLLGRMIDTDPATMLGIVKRLAERGYIQRAADDTHKRKISLTLTPEGNELIDLATEAAQQVSADTLVGLSDREQQQLLGLLQKLVITTATD